VAGGIGSQVGVLRTKPDELDAIVALGVKKGHLKMVA
jgi:hypothetical protein